MMKKVKEKEVLENDMQVAGNIQRQLMPKSFPDNKQIEFYGGSQEAEGVGGDYFDIIDLGEGKYLCAIADVTGHDIASSLVMVKIQTLLQTYVYREIIDPLEILKEINKCLFDEIKGEKFVTMCLVLIG